MKLVLGEPFLSLWRGKDPFVEVEKLQGKIFRDMKVRRTLRVEIDGRGYFVKIHRGCSWWEIVKNLLTLKLPVLGAAQEWKALERLHQAKIPTMTVAAFGERGSNPARRHSFIITREIAPSVDLETFARAAPPSLALKRALIKKVAEIVGVMHRAGVNHRDCYICHFLLSGDSSPEASSLALIDLHRAQVRAAVPKRWRDKDLAALYFSIMEIGMTRRDRLRFLRDYFGHPLREILREEPDLFPLLEKKMLKLYLRKQRYGDAL
ncbi:MAG: lipopolysaccharide core heptose(I) kinase RfaP [Candidatus Accumulibacter sp.]|jgi:heptose I phosphotransferase|nr:lipopolysaccharide core heptose(I) kinase RfaP [Accumulibacter sp.]